MKIWLTPTDMHIAVLAASKLLLAGHFNFGVEGSHAEGTGRRTEDQLTSGIDSI